MTKYQNVFDNKEEFDKLFNYIIDGINKYTDERKGNVTYGEILFVLESVLEEFSEKCGIERLESRVSKIEEQIQEILKKIQ